MNFGRQITADDQKLQNKEMKANQSCSFLELVSGCAFLKVENSIDLSFASQYSRVFFPYFIFESVPLNMAAYSHRDTGHVKGG